VLSPLPANRPASSVIADESGLSLLRPAVMGRRESPDARGRAGSSDRHRSGLVVRA